MLIKERKEKEPGSNKMMKIQEKKIDFGEMHEVYKIASFEELVHHISCGRQVYYKAGIYSILLDTYYNDKVYGRIHDRRIGIDKDGKHWYYDEEEFIRNTCTVSQGR